MKIDSDNKVLKHWHFT